MNKTKIDRKCYRCCNNTIRSSAAAVVFFIFSIVTDGGFLIESNTELLVSGSTGLTPVSANIKKNNPNTYETTMFRK